MTNVATPYLETDIAAIAERIAAEAAGLSGARILMVGGAGFLGRYFLAVFDHLNRHVLDTPCRLRVVDNFRTSNTALLPAPSTHVEIVDRDVCDLEDDGEPYDWVVHAAGIASPFYYRAYPLQTLEVATRGTHRLLEIADRAKARFIYFSSSEIYGDPDPSHVPTKESYRGNVATLGPRACYDEGKRVGETYCYVFHEYNGVHTNIIRPFNVFGPGMQAKDYRVMPSFAAQIIEGAPLNVYGDGRQTRTYCYIEDAMVGFFRVMLKGVPGEAYNIGTPKPEISVNELATFFAEASERPVSVITTEYPDSYPADEPMRRCPDIRKAELQLDYAPRVDLRDGLARFLTWAEAAYAVET